MKSGALTNKHAGFTLAEVLAALLLFAALMIGALGLMLLPIVLKVRRVPPPVQSASR